MDFNIEQLATLSRIALKEEEKAHLEADLEKILKYVEEINELDLEGVEPTSHVLALEDVFRPDEIIEQPEVAKKVLEALPESAKSGTFFKVPKIIEERQ